MTKLFMLISQLVLLHFFKSVINIFNFFQVEIENPDLEKFPFFSNAPYSECILEEGELLFIPKKWWHYVKSLSLSFSVSFWW